MYRALDPALSCPALCLSLTILTGLFLYILPFLPQASTLLHRLTTTSSAAIPERSYRRHRTVRSISVVPPPWCLSLDRLTVLPQAIPCRDEGATIASTVYHVLTSAAVRERVRVVIAVDPASSDNTFNEASRLSRSEPAVSCLWSDAPGRGAALDKAISGSTDDSILMLHADTKLPARWDELLIDALERPGVMMTAFEFSIDRDTVLHYPFTACTLLSASSLARSLTHYLLSYSGRGDIPTFAQSSALLTFDPNGCGCLTETRPLG